MIPLSVYQLGSGSRGNLTAVAGPGGVVLVDAGFSARECLGRIAAAGLDRQEIKAIVLSHCHLDHARGAAIMARRLKVPIWGSEFTLANLSRRSDREEVRVLPLTGTSRIAGLTVDTHPASHDIPGTVLIRLAHRYAIATDLGRVCPSVRDFLSGLEGLQLEFNHDPELLAAGPYPPALQARIRSDRGHLSNRQAAELLQDPDFIPPRRHLVLAHLSARNNRPELARATALEALTDPPEIHLAHQDRSLPPLLVE